MNDKTHCPHCGKSLQDVKSTEQPANPHGIEPPFYALEVPENSGMYFDDKGWGGATGVTTVGTSDPMQAKRYETEAAARKAGLNHFGGNIEGWRVILVTGE